MCAALSRHFFVTNDDSHSSPLLHFLVEYLAARGEVTVVVPKHEQSWKGKAITRFHPLHVEEIELFGRKAYTVDGTPADCANVGLFHLCPVKPALVVSGINAGENSGSSFMLSSGTVGACFEANFAGFPALALSQQFDSATRALYSAEYNIEAETLGRFLKQAEVTLDAVLPGILEDSEIGQAPITWNVNIPFTLAEPFRVGISRVAVSCYGSLFQLGATGFEHALSTISTVPDEQSDVEHLRRGEVSMTPINPHSLGSNLDSAILSLARRVISRGQ